MRGLHGPRTAALVLALAGALALGLAGAGAASTQMPVSIVARAYQPAELTVEAGHTVTWRNDAFSQHTVTAAGGEFDSGPLSPGESFAVTFNTPGTFAYACTIHPSMKGEVTVLPARPPGSPPLPTSLQLTLAKARTARGELTLVRVLAPRPGATVLLQLRSPRGRWSTVEHARLSSLGSATLRLAAGVHAKLRVVVPSVSGAPPLISRALAPRR
ncbi:MAG TPA: cupredoxin family copper-binding protein [Solirubrobacteraceae bacterium]|nr:cupredoxin family copper-binding protein [Solirubrobacteraceae bacterium]